MHPIWALGIPVVEDAAHAAESTYRGRKLGGLSDATCFSLYATKNIAAGEGGLVATNRDDIADAIRNLRLMRRGDGSLYDITVPGYKANLSDVLAAIALVQLDKLPEHTAAIRERQFALYDVGLAGLDGIEPLARDPRDTHALHLYIVRVDAERGGLTRDELQARAGGGADRDVDPLPARAPSQLVPRALPRPADASGRRAGRPRDPVAAALPRPLRRRHRGCDRGARADPRPRRMKRGSPRPRDARAHRPRASPISSGRSTSTRRADVIAAASPWWFLLAVAIMIAHRRADGRTLAPAAQGAGHARAAAVADPGVLRLLHRRPDPAHLDRRRRRPDPRDLPSPPRRLGATSAIVLLERALGGAATVLLGAVGFVLAIGRYDVGAYLWIEGAFVLVTLRARLPDVLALGAADPARDRAAAAAAPARTARARGLRRHPRLPRAHRPARRVVRLHRRDPGRARARDLGDRAGGGDRALAADLLRDGPAALPRPARPVHAERLRGPRGVLRQLPRRCRRRRGPGVRSRVPLLPRHGRAGASRRRDPALGGAARRAPAAIDHA